MGSIRTLAWNPTGHLIATGSADRTLRIWNPDRASVKNSTELRGHTGAIERVAWNPTKETELASCSSDGTVRFWDVRSKGCSAEVKIGGEGFTLAWSPDGRTVVAGRKVGPRRRRVTIAMTIDDRSPGRYPDPHHPRRSTQHLPAHRRPFFASTGSNQPDHLLALGPRHPPDHRRRHGQDPVLSRLRLRLHRERAHQRLSLSGSLSTRKISCGWR